MHRDDLLAGLDELDFPAVTGDPQTSKISWYLRRLGTGYVSPEAAQVLSRGLADELWRGPLSDGPAEPLATIFLARLAIFHPLEHVRQAALNVMPDLRDDWSPWLVEVLEEAVRTAYVHMRSASRDQDVSGALRMVALVQGPTARLMKQIRRLELRSRNERVIAACRAIRSR
jgi:hypothetical protein